jgi:hypothetical protein
MKVALLLPLTSLPIALFCGPYLCICVFGCSLLWLLFVHLHFLVLYFVTTICAFALLGALFCGRYLCVHMHLWVLSLDWSSLVIPSLFPLPFHLGCFYKVLLGFIKKKDKKKYVLSKIEIEKITTSL